LSDDRFAGTAPASGPPAPTAKTTSTSGLPINDYIYILILAALIFGCYIIQRETKPSI
jgi:hypothetical protein